MRYNYFLKSVLFSFLGGCAIRGLTQEAEKIMLHSSQSNKVKVVKDITYKTLDDTKQLTFDFYKAVVKNSMPAPLVILMNGFGDAELKNRPVQTEWARLIASDGLSAITFSSHADVEGDFDALINHLNKNAGSYNFNGDVLVMAFSGNVIKGLPIITSAKRKSIKAAVIYYGRGDITDYRQDMPVLFVRSGLDNAAWNRRIDSMLFQVVSHNAPWTIINHHSGTHPFEFDAADGQSILVLKQTLEFMHSALSAPVMKSIQTRQDYVAAGTASFLKDWEQAVVYYEKIVKADPQDAESFFGLGIAYFGKGEDADALVAFDKALTLGYGKIRDLSIPASAAAAHLKDKEVTLKWLKLLATAPGGVQYIKRSKDYEFLNNDERFLQIIKPN